MTPASDLLAFRLALLTHFASLMISENILCEQNDASHDENPEIPTTSQSIANRYATASSNYSAQYTSADFLDVLIDTPVTSVEFYTRVRRSVLRKLAPCVRPVVENCSPRDFIAAYELCKRNGGKVSPMPLIIQKIETGEIGLGSYMGKRVDGSKTNNEEDHEQNDFEVMAQETEEEYYGRPCDESMIPVSHGFAGLLRSVPQDNASDVVIQRSAAPKTWQYKGKTHKVYPFSTPRRAAQTLKIKATPATPLSCKWPLA